MLGRVVGVAAICALGASAILLPPSIASAGDGVPDLALSIVDPKRQEIRIPCAECAFPETPGEVKSDVEDAEGEEWFWVQGGAKDLVLDFKISEDGNTLVFGEQDIYPPHLREPRKPSYVKQVAHNTPQAELEAGTARAADVLVTMHATFIDKEVLLTPEGDQIVELSFRLLDLEHQRMTLPEVQIQLLKTAAGELLIMEVTSKPLADSLPISSFPPSPPPPALDDMDKMPLDMGPPPHHGFPHGPHGFTNHKDCNVLPAPLCRLKNILETKLDAAMGPPRHRGKTGGCRGRKGGSADKTRPGLAESLHLLDEAREQRHHGRPHHMRPHDGHHRHRHGHFWGHRMLRAVVKGLLGALIPMLAGITIGLSVSLVGLIVGRLIGYVWSRFVRGGRRGSVVQEEVVLETGEDKAMLAEMEAPPVYEDAPAYDETEKEVR